MGPPRRFTRFDFSAEKRPAVGINDSGFVVAKLKQVFALLVNNGIADFFHETLRIISFIE
tara:strand:- start:249 stop:428 length:180 start_codon:yes stop_codon:yes gene_type:complete